MSQIFRTFIAIFFLSITATFAQEPPVSGDEILKEWVNRTMIGSDPKGYPLTMKFHSDGSIELALGSLNESGKWRAIESGYCTTWKTIRAGQERCYSVRRSGTKFTVFNPDGTVSGYFTGIQ
jgi:hypothetical protein